MPSSGNSSLLHTKRKNGRGVHGLLPKQLVPLLEEFISEHRHHLLGR